MTEIRVIKKTLKMWEWLYDNPCKRKKDAPFYNKYESSCLCCNFYDGSCDESEGKCPLKPKQKGSGCANGAYSDWSDADNKKQSREASIKIVTQLRKRYDEIKGEDIMTEENAVDLSLHMWEWLHDNPTKKKVDYPHYYESDIDVMRASCPCCEYYLGVLPKVDPSSEDSSCNSCPLDGESCANGSFSKWENAVFCENVERSKIMSGKLVEMLKERHNELLGCEVEKTPGEKVEMTEAEAVKLSLHMWDWLVSHPLSSKQDYPKFQELNINKMKDGCPCCDHYRMCQNGCPLNVDSSTCGGGRYSRWAKAKDVHTSVMFATEIRDLLKAKYNELWGEVEKEVEMIQTSIRLWEWLNENPLDEKKDYPQYHADGIDNMKDGCPCCEFYGGWSRTIYRRRGGCLSDNCPLNLGDRLCAGGWYDEWQREIKDENYYGSQNASSKILNMLRKKHAELITGKVVDQETRDKQQKEIEEIEVKQEEESIIGGISIKKEFRFEASHRLMDYDGKCSNIHGHNYIVWAHVRRKDNKLDEQDMVIDFGDLKTGLGAWIDEQWDHAFLYNFDDKEVTAMFRDTDHKKYSMNGNPTAERMAAILLNVSEYIYREDDIVVFKIEVFENDGCVAIAESGSGCQC